MNKIKGIAYAGLSAAIYGFMPLIVKMGAKHGASTEMMVFSRYMFSFIFLGIFINLIKGNFKVKKKNLLKISYLGVIGCGFTSIMLYLSYNYIATGTATVIHFTYPVVATILAFILLHEPLTMKKILSLSISVMGFMILIGFKNNNFNYIGVIIALISGISYATYIVGVGDNSIKKMDPFILTFYMTGFASAAMGIYAFIKGKFSYSSIDLVGIFMLIMLALVCTVTTLVLFVKAVDIIGASNAAILSTLEPVISVIVGIIILHDVFNLTAFWGSTLILCSVFILILPEKKHFSSVGTVNK